MPLTNITTELHTSTKRNYLERVENKAKYAKVAKEFGYDYWDGDRNYGFGGYKYDERWKAVAEKLAKTYNLKKGDKVLDVGCGKGFLLYELSRVIEGLEIYGIDISDYAIENCKEEVSANLQKGLAQKLPFDDNYFDFVYTITTLHNLYLPDLISATKEIIRVSNKGGNSYINVESYRNEEEKVNLLYWQLTCESFYTPSEWEYIFDMCGYKGDYEFIYFE